MNEAHKNPFPGLRPFMFHEHELFFGREEQYEQMIAKLGETRFLAVVGTSGSGKSSLVRAGLLPALYGGQMMSAGSNWRIAVFRPKDDPIRELAAALNHRRVFGDRSKENGSSLFKLTESIDWSGLCSRLTSEAHNNGRGPSARILEILSPERRHVIAKAAGNGDINDKSEIVQAFNELLKDRDLYQEPDFRSVLTGDARALLTQGQGNLSDAEIEKLNRGLLEASYPEEIAKKVEIHTQVTEVTLRRGDLGLIGVTHEAQMAPDENLLVVVDQFEELFRYANISEHGPHGNQAAAFVKLLLEAKSQTQIPIYVVLTMRSDYLGDCARFWDLPEAINEGQYLIPRLTRDQRREAIKGPIQLSGADITPQLVNQLLNEMGDDPDQLPILQHALMRTWDRWEKDHQDHEPIDVRHYVAIGRMAGALSLHADEAYDELPDDRSRSIAERLFKCLTEKGRRNRETRRPTSVSVIQTVTDVRFEDLVSVINVFRLEGRSFLMPSWRKALKGETSIDISHESLIRNWTKLKEWVKEEARSANVYRRLVESARLKSEGGADLLTGLEVDHAVKWLEREKPNVVWASRYHGDLETTNKGAAVSDKEREARDRERFQGAMAFLEESRIEHERTIKRNERMHRREIRQGQIRKFAAVLAVAFVVLVIAATVIFWQLRSANRANVIKAHLTYGGEMNLAHREFEDGNFARVSHLLEDPNEILAQDPALRGFEWYHLWLLSHNELRTVSRDNSSPVLSVAFPNDSATLAFGKQNGDIELKDINTYETLAKLPTGSENVAMLGISPDRLRVGVGRMDGSVDLWNVSADVKQQPQRIELVKPPAKGSQPNPDAAVVSLTFSPDSKLLAVGMRNGDVRLWETAPNKELAKIRSDETATEKELARIQAGERYPASSLAFSPDGSSLAIGRTGTVARVDLSTVDLSTRRVLLMDLDKAISIAEREDAERVPIKALAFRDHNTLAMGRDDSTVVLWDLAENKFLFTLVGHSMKVNAVAFSKEGILATGSGDGSIKLWDVEELLRPDIRQSLIERNSYLEKSSRPLSRANLNPESAVEQANREREFRSKVSSELLIGTLKGHAGAVKSMAFSPDSQTLVSGGQDGFVKLWPARMDGIKKARQVLGWPSSNGLSSLAFSGDGKLLATGSYDGSAKLWNMDPKQSEGGNHEKLQEKGPPISAVAFSPDSKILATGSWDNKVTLRDVSTRGKLAELSGHSNYVISIAFSPDGKTLASGSADNTVRLWDVNTRQLIMPITWPGAVVLSLAFSPDGATLAMAMTDKTVRLWDMEKGKESRTLTGHTDAVSAVAFSRDGTLATGSWDATARLWNPQSGQELATLQGHSLRVLSVSFSPDGKRLATGSQDGGVKLWDTSYDLGGKNTRHALVTLRGQEGWKGEKGVSLVAAVSVAFKPGNGKILAIGNADGTALLCYAAEDNVNARH